MNHIWSNVQWQTSYLVHEYHQIVTVRCADARDVGKVENEVTHRLMIENAASGIHIDLPYEPAHPILSE